MASSGVKKAEKRFEIISSDNGLNTSFNIIKDKKTGVLYFWVRGTMSGAMSPLLDSEGNPTIEEPDPDFKD